MNLRKSYDLVLPLGRDCSCSMYLRRNKLQFKSYPFDWLTNAPLRPRLEIILNDFSGFLELADLRLLEKDASVDNDTHCDYYENTAHGFYYYHDFLAGSDLAEKFPSVKEKYNRRIDRFIDDVQSKRNVLLVWFAHQEPDFSDDELIEYSEKLSKKFGKKIDLLVFENRKELATDVYELVDLAEGVTKCLANTYPEDREDITMGNVSLCDQVFRKHIKLASSLRSLRVQSTVRGAVLKFLSQFIFYSKTKRRAFRQKYLR